MTKDEAITQLRDSRSPRRRSAAKFLRKLGDTTAGPALLEAFRKELADPRTWETQYQLVMALGTCHCTEALPLLQELAREARLVPTPLLAVGDALVRLERRDLKDATPILPLREHRQ